MKALKSNALKTAALCLLAICVSVALIGCGGNGGAVDIPIDMVLVEGGTFTMGCTPEQGDDCIAAERGVTVSDFYIGKYEVTQKQWKGVMGTSIEQHRALADLNERENNNDELLGVGDDYPMYYVNLGDIQEFIDRLNSITGKKYRLPTDAEWEYAARGGNKSRGHKFAGGNNNNDVAWCGKDLRDRGAQPVGTKLSNELGIYDMSGNVEERVNEGYIDDAKTIPSIPSCVRSIVRGGAWVSETEDCRMSSFTCYYYADEREFHIGFRLALDP